MILIAGSHRRREKNSEGENEGQFFRVNLDQVNRSTDIANTSSRTERVTRPEDSLLMPFSRKVRKQLRSMSVINNSRDPGQDSQRGKYQQ